MSVADDLLYAPVKGSATNTPNMNVNAGDMKLPASWIDMITQLRRFWPEAALAGGALRDLDLGRAIKDVDIFIPAEVPVSLLGLTMWEAVDTVVSRCRPNTYVLENKHDPSQNSAVSKGIQVLSHYEFWIDGWKFEITQKVEPFTQRSILDSFDLGLCMICLDGLSIYRSPEYQHDAANETITIVRNTGGRERKHASRLHYKYEGWKVI